MDSTRRTFRMLRRVATMAALAALLMAGTAEAAKKISKPVVTKVAPMDVSIGETLTVYGKNFLKGKGRNSVVFKRDGAPAVFVKSDVATRRQIKVVLPEKLAKYLQIKDGTPSATQFRIRVLSSRFGKTFTALKLSPKVGPAKPPEAEAPPASAPDADCDGDGVLNSLDNDDDNDLLSDDLEKPIDKGGIGTDPCKFDTDEDGVSDGYEFQSARDLNDDTYQSPDSYLPYPGKKPYPNALYKDADLDYDGDGLWLADEFRLWQKLGSHTTTDGAPLSSVVTPQKIVLNYSDGKQYSETIPTVGYPKAKQFLDTAAAEGYSQQLLLDFDAGVRSNYWSKLPSEDPKFNGDGAITDVERYYYDRDYDGKLSDDERDEDADGLPNWFEARGPMQPDWWAHVYGGEHAYVIPYAGTDLADADTDGDGIIDGADDSDHDDLPNVREIRRQLVAGERAASASYTRFTMGGNPHAIIWNRLREGTGDNPSSSEPKRAWVQPFNPCLPDPESRTCERYPNLGALYPPFDAQTKIFNVFDGSDRMPE